MIDIQNVTFRYHPENEPVIRNLNPRIEPGESVCIMGANGSGKSTLARILAGLLPVSEGKVHIRDSDKTPLPVGIIFQNPDNQIIAVTVEKEIAFALENMGVPLAAMKQRVDETLKRFSISHLRSRLTSELSGGEKQRVALASVMICEPPILILDEPDSFLDEKGRRALLNEEELIRKRNPDMIIIRVTQYLAVARRYSRLVVFENGQIIADDTPQKIFSDHSVCYQAGLCYDKDRFKTVDIESLVGMNNGIGPRLEKIVAEKISFGYSSNDFLFEKLDFKINRGEITGLIGPTGSGKSSLGQIISSLLKPSDGHIKYLDNNNREIASDKIIGKVTGVFQQPERQFFLPTCKKEITFGPSNFGRQITQEGIKALFELVGLAPDKFADRDPFTLSMGEKRRLAFASVVSLSPGFIVFDEPTCGLDIEGVGRFVYMAETLKKAGLGLVIISHDGSLIKKLADWIFYLPGDLSCHIKSKDTFFNTGQHLGVLSSVEENSIN